jgi:hypothetical protein
VIFPPGTRDKGFFPYHDGRRCRSSLSELLPEKPSFHLQLFSSPKLESVKFPTTRVQPPSLATARPETTDHLQDLRSSILKMSDRQPNIELRSLNSADFEAGVVREAAGPTRIGSAIGVIPDGGTYVNGGVLQFNNGPSPSINSIRRRRNLKVLLVFCIASVILALSVFFYYMFK